MKMMKTTDAKKQAAENLFLARKKASEILTEILGAPVDYALLPRTEDGKPFFPNDEMFFSLSHSGAYVGIAASFTAPLGFDLQKEVPLKVDAKKMALRFFSENEQRLLASVKSDADAERLFLRLFSVKEAYAKYTGAGMTKGFATDISLSEGIVYSPCAAKEKDAPESERLASFIEPALSFEGYVSAVCADEIPKDLIVRIESIPFFPAQSRLPEPESSAE